MRQIPLSPLLLILLFGAAITLTACGNEDSPPTPTAGASMKPAPKPLALSPELQAIYDRSCKNCHSVPNSGAPQTGDATAWAPRQAKGADLLLEHTIAGFQAMPPMGACMDCSEEQFSALIAYMASTRPTAGE